jgi:hypothetical protein
LIEGVPADVRPGKIVVFSEIQDGKEVNCCGLESFIHYSYRDKHVFFFDNHNHAFFFWLYSLKNKYFSKGLPLVHVDQHKDMRRPAELLPVSQAEDTDKIFSYTQNILNVGDFIVPALELGIFSNVIDVSSSAGFEKDLPDELVLDIDMDIFSQDMDYIGKDIKMKYLKEAVERAAVITVATSPYFIDQSKAVELIQELFGE